MEVGQLAAAEHFHGIIILYLALPYVCIQNVKIPTLFLLCQYPVKYYLCMTNLTKFSFLLLSLLPTNLSCWTRFSICA